jgi:repressor LexA
MSEVTNYLTERQAQILDFIQTFSADKGFSPTHREICERFGYSSYGTVHKHLKLLEKKGFLRRDWNQKRGVELVKRGESGAPAPEIPFYGRIAAGRPIEAIRDREMLAVPPSLMRGTEGDHFVLKVVGDSMIDDGIHDGDLVVVQRRESAASGEMVVALVEDEATLKRFFPENGQVRLQPSNRLMEPMLVPAEKVRVQGVAVGLMRRF